MPFYIKIQRNGKDPGDDKRYSAGYALGAKAVGKAEEYKDGKNREIKAGAAASAFSAPAASGAFGYFIVRFPLGILRNRIVSVKHNRHPTALYQNGCPINRTTGKIRTVLFLSCRYYDIITKMIMTTEADGWN